MMFELLMSGERNFVIPVFDGDASCDIVQCVLALMALTAALAMYVHPYRTRICAISCAAATHLSDLVYLSPAYFAFQW